MRTGAITAETPDRFSGTRAGQDESLTEPGMRYVPLFDLSPGGVEYGVPGTPFPSRHTPQLGGSHVSWGEIDHNVNEKESPGKLAPNVNTTSSVPFKTPPRRRPSSGNGPPSSSWPSTARAIPDRRPSRTVAAAGQPLAATLGRRLGPAHSHRVPRKPRRLAPGHRASPPR